MRRKEEHAADRHHKLSMELTAFRRLARRRLLRDALCFTAAGLFFFAIMTFFVAAAIAVYATPR
jgi:hypothetical protein